MMDVLQPVRLKLVGSAFYSLVFVNYVHQNLKYKHAIKQMGTPLNVLRDIFPMVLIAIYVPQKIILELATLKLATL